jgi:hypothetical protein
MRQNFEEHSKSTFDCKCVVVEDGGGRDVGLEREVDQGCSKHHLDSEDTGVSMKD